jgi:hypothetical protein
VPTGQSGDTVKLPESAEFGEREQTEPAGDRQGETVELPPQPQFAEHDRTKPIGDRHVGSAVSPRVATSDDEGPSKGAGQERGDTGVTIDSGQVDTPPETVDTLLPPTGAETAAYGPSQLSAKSANDQTREWGSSIAHARRNETIRGPSEQYNPAESTLVVHPRALRSMDDTQLPIADYDLLGRLGEGGMGVVYSARQASIDRKVAIKMLKPSLADDDSHRKKFLSEAVVTGELDHPNIVPIYDMGTDSHGALFYSMKQVQGKPWLKVIRKKSPQENLEILMKVADAVAFAHSRGVVHRDLKPENVMLGEFGEVLMLDWGMAMLTPDCSKSANVSQTAARGGTPGYMAPEMAAGPLERVGKHSDVYLLGAILYECITGNMPHGGNNVWECLKAAEENRIEPTAHTGELIDVAMKAMAGRPADRYESVQAFQ